VDDRARTSTVRALPGGHRSRRIARVTPNPLRTIETLEHDAPLPEGPGDRFSGYAIMALSFKSGHVLALRRFAASTIGPAYSSVWHRDPSHRWTFYATLPPDLSCARYFGGEVHRNILGPIEITWDDATRFRVVVNAGVEWQVTVGTSLRRGAMNLAGLTPNGHRFSINCRHLRLIKSSHAVVKGVNLGRVGPSADQSALGDLLLPQRGLFAIARARFEQPSRSLYSGPRS
jgi:hypothetical protein